MKIKICGLKDKNNISQVSEANPEYMGFIFYPKSPRFVGDKFEKNALELIPGSIVKTAVFVNESVENIVSIVDNYSFNAIQLHGNESPEMCMQLKDKKLIVIKAFAIDEGFDFNSLIPYETHCDYFLFDTKTPAFGGSGKTFDWKLLSQYQLETPFFLSGGLGIENLEAILKLKHEKLYGLDFNSKLEDSPGIKNLQMINTVLVAIRNYEHI
jgi:phosphoribosylanthranilate isomerase